MEFLLYATCQSGQIYSEVSKNLLLGSIYEDDSDSVVERHDNVLEADVVVIWESHESGTM